MADKIFHTWFLEKVAPVWADKVMISDSEAMNQTKFTDIANLPISTATSTAIWVVQSDIDIHEARTDNPHSVTKSQVWLSNVDNTSDSTKNSATATLTNKTIISPVINTPTGIVKSDVGLWNVDNTTDALKPISTATQTALNAKQDTITGLTASGAELNILDGATLSTTELNYVDGVTSAIQTQLDTKSSLTQLQNNTKQDLALAITPNYDAISGAIVLDSSKNHYHWIANGWGATGMTINSFSIIPQWENVPAGLFISQDGINMYVIWNTLNTVLQYALWTPYNISTASYVRSKDVSAQSVNQSDVFFNPDGTKMYVQNAVSSIYQYNLWTAWDISTSVYYGLYSTATQTTAVRGFFISPDWTKFYTCENSADDTCYQYSMWTAWDITTASYSGNKKNVNLDDGSSQSIAFSFSWAEMFILWDTGNNITKYNLWTAWDISTAIVNPIKLYVGVEESGPYWIRFSANWDDVYIVGAGKTIYQYNLIRPYQLFTDITYVANGWLNGWWVYDFDWVDDYIELNDWGAVWNTYTNGFTIMGWIKPDSDGEAALWIVISKNAGTLAQSWYYYSVNANTMRMRIADWAGTWTNRASAAGSITYWVWTHVTVTVDNTWVVTHYINAVQSGTPWVSAAPSNITTTNATRIGNRSAATDRTFDGYIWQVRIISRVLTATEIANDYLQRTEIDNPPEVPRLTTAMRDVMSPSLWQQVYNTTTNKAQVYNGAWNDLY